MKYIVRTLIAVAIAAVLSACSEDDATKDYGFAKVYIPQATMTGLDNSYPIPSGPFYQNSTYTCRYDRPSGILNVALGVIRSGYFKEQKAFSVDLGVSAAETTRKLSEYTDKGTPAVQLPQDLCTIPGKISVPADSADGTCYIGIDIKKLALQQASLYTGTEYKLLVLGLEISNPTEYELSDNYTSVVLVLDLNSQYWDDVAEDKPESDIRSLFPIY